MLKSYLASKDVAFTEKHADEDQSIAEELYEKSGQLGVPFTLITEEGKEDIPILGFDRQKVDQILGLA